MSDPFGRERPVQPTGTRSRASKNRKAERVEKRDARTLARLRVVEWAIAQMEAEPELSIAGCYILLREAAQDQSLSLTPPSRATFFRWMEIAQRVEGTPSARDFQERPRSGRPRHIWHPQVVEYFEDLMLAQIHDSVSELFREIERYAKEHKLPVPGEDSIRSRYDAFDLAARSAARHGRKAARADAMVKSTVPAEFPHHYWTLDELHATVWIRAFHPLLRRLVSVRTWVILTVDNFSRVPVGFYVCEPFRGMTTTVGFDSEEVMGAFYSAAIPDLAPPEARPFTGYLPRILRMDGAAQHIQLKMALRKHGVGAEKLEKGTPWSRGSVERLIGGIDSICQPIRGHMAGIIPADQVKQTPEEVRTGAAATSLRHRRKHVVAVESLPTLSEFREDFARELHRYAIERRHSMIGVTPEVAYFNHLRPEELRSGLDATLMLPPVTLTVGKGGLMHRKTYFAPEVAGRKLDVGEQLVCRPDPLKRGLFVEVSGQPVFLPTKDEWARMQNPEHLVGEEKAIAKAYSEAAAAAQRRVLAEQFKGADTGPVESLGKGAPEVWDRTPLVEPDVQDAGTAEDKSATPPTVEGKRKRRSKTKAAPSAPPLPAEPAAVLSPDAEEDSGGGENLETDAAEALDEAAGAETVRPVFRVVPGASKPAAAVPEAPSLPRGLVRSRKAHLRVEK